MSGRLTPSERSLHSRMAAHALHASHDSREIIAKARAASPAAADYFINKVDPQRELPEAERLRRAEHARKSYFAGLQLKSARARKKAS